MDGTYLAAGMVLGEGSFHSCGGTRAEAGVGEDLVEVDSGCYRRFKNVYRCESGRCCSLSFLVVNIFNHLTFPCFPFILIITSN